MTWRALMSCSLHPGGRFAIADADGTALGAAVGAMLMLGAADAAALAAAEATGAALPLASGFDVAYCQAWPAAGAHAATVAATRPVPARAAPRRNPRRVTARSMSPAGGPPGVLLGVPPAALPSGVDWESCSVTVSMGRHGTRPERGPDGTFVTISRVRRAKHMRMRASRRSVRERAPRFR